jgi:gas vesicle protein
MKSEIEEQLGQQIQQEISKGFLENISGMTKLIHDNFSQMKESNQQHYEGVINHITNEKTAKI